MAEGSPRSLGPYRIAGELGRGAMGVVYRAFHRRDGTPVALKTVRLDLIAASEREAALRRLRQEARILAKLEHPDIVRAYDYGEDGELTWLALEPVGGVDLLRAVQESGATNPAFMVLRLVRRLLGALAYLHERGIVHRDVKPANVMVTREGGLKLMDFGVAHAPDGALTSPRSMLGTPAYMAPELLRGEQVDGRADLFAVGVLLYQLLTGRRPFAGSVAETITAVLTREPPPPSRLAPTLPPSLDALVMEALAKDPERRIASAGRLADRIQACLLEMHLGLVEQAAADVTVQDLPLLTLEAGTADEGTLALAIDSLLAALTEALEGGSVQAATGAARRGLEALAAATEAQGGPAGAALRRLNHALDHTLGSRLESMLLDERSLSGGAAAEADWTARVELLATIRAVRHRIPEPPTVRGGDRLVEALRTRSLLYAAEVNRMIASPAHPALDRITADFHRLDLQHWALETLGAAEAAADVALQARLLAALVLRKVNLLLSGAGRSDEALAREEAAGMLVAVEDVIALTRRVLDREVLERGEGFLAVQARELLRDFIASAQRLTARTARELRQAVAGPADLAAEIPAPLDRLGYLYRFALELSEVDDAGRVAALVESVHRLMQDLAEATRARRRADPTDPAAPHLLAALYEFGAQQDWHDYCAPLLADLRDIAVRTPRDGARNRT